MKNIDIINLVNAGILDASASTLSSHADYLVYKFKKELKKVFTDIQDCEKELIGQCGIEDPQAFDERLKELHAIENKNEEQAKEYADMTGTLTKLYEMRNELYNEDAPVVHGKRLSWDEWHALKAENKGKKFTSMDEVLEGILWEDQEGGDAA